MRDPRNLLCPACFQLTRKIGSVRGDRRPFECTHCHIVFNQHTRHRVLARLRDLETRSYTGSSLAGIIRDDSDEVDGVHYAGKKKVVCKMSPESIRRARLLRDEGMNVVCLAKRFGTSQSTIRRWLERREKSA
jgi:hypothetical protein